MSLRAVVIGLIIGLCVAAAAYYNETVIRQAALVNNHLPGVVFGSVALLLAFGPLMRLFGGKGLRPAEIGVIVAIALAGSGSPGTSFFRLFAPVMVMPAHWAPAEPHWLATDVMSFVPGGSGNLAPEHLPDASRLSAVLRDAAEARDTPAGRIWSFFSRMDRWQVEQLVDDPAPRLEDRRALAAAMNRVLAQPDLYSEQAFAAVKLPAPLVAKLTHGRTDGLDRFGQVKANRLLVTAALPELVLPPPRGAGLLFMNAQPHTRTHDLLIDGGPSTGSIGLLELPWADWWPTLRLWVGMAALLGIAALCLALIVHPQWSERELLPYPIARFVQELSHTSGARQLPDIVGKRGFWVALIGLGSVNLLNGLQGYFEFLPQISMSLNFSPLRDLFPGVARIHGSAAYFEPTIYPAVTAFAVLLTVSVSFSLGIAQLLLLLLTAFLVGQGIMLERDYLGSQPMNLMAFGAFLGMFVIIAYTGRRYYTNVAASMIGLRRDPATPAYAPLAGWGLSLSLILAIALLHSGGLPVILSAAFVLLVMLLWLVLSRISAEVGLVLLKPAWLPVGVLTALLGADAIGPAAYLGLAVATMVIVGDAREVIMPFLTNGLRLMDQEVKRRRAGRLSLLLAVMILASILIAGTASFLTQHNTGLNMSSVGMTRHMPNRPFNAVASYISDARAAHTLDAAVTATGVERLMLLQPEPGMWGWAALGFGLLLVTAAARLRLAWWPFHPVIFLVWGTWPMFRLSFTILLGCAIKALLLGLGGTRAYRAAIPFLVGIILADLLAVLVFTVIGAGYHFVTATPPPLIRFFP